MEENAKLEEIFNIDPPKVVHEIEVIQPAVKTNSEAEDDFQLVRNNLKDIIEKSNLAVEGILNLASETDQPRAYEVVSTLINTTIEANKALMDAHKTLKEIKNEGPKSEKNITNNSIFVGSTKELMNIIKNRKKELKQLEEAPPEQKSQDE